MLTNTVGHKDTLGMKSKIPVQKRILDSAMQLMGDKGILKLAQPQIAKHSGVPQGHITYYYPKRADLILAIERESMETLASFMRTKLAKTPRAMTLLLATIKGVVKDHARARMLIGLLVESEENAELKEKLVERTIMGEKLVADCLGWDEKDPEVRLVHATLWGLSLYNLLFDNKASRAMIDNYIKDVAAKRK